MENVNLCSPAILDRLNGLLEPNGELTLGEKGVDNSGALLTVKPHPNFRLFFTMDPQRGEISRLDTYIRNYYTGDMLFHFIWFFKSKKQKSHFLIAKFVLNLDIVLCF